MTFFTIGVVSDFRKLWQEGIGKLALVYVLCLFGFIIWVGLAISWIFFHGVKPPVNRRGDAWKNRRSPKNSRRWNTSRCCRSN